MNSYLSTIEAAAIAEYFRNSQKRLILLDYDGTLVPYKSDPSKALPDMSLLQLLKDLSNTKGLDLAIISGRDREFLDEIFSDLNADIFAEHGALHRTNGNWKLLYNDLSWQKEIIRIIQEVTDITPGSVLEKKESSVVWHYRNIDTGLARQRIKQLISKLTSPVNRRKLRIMKGRKIIEVKPSEYTKGSAVMNFFDCSIYNFILAAGDDTTDEDLFDALPDTSITINIGKFSGKSTYIIRNSSDFVSFLRLLIK